MARPDESADGVLRQVAGLEAGERCGGCDDVEGRVGGHLGQEREAARAQGTL